MVRKISKKKYKQHFYWDKNKKISIKFFYNFLIFIIVCLGLFLVISIYFSAVDYINKSEVIAEKKEMQFMFVDNQWVSHNIGEESAEHWASSKWDYLFRDYTTGDTIGTWIVNTWSVNSSWSLLTWNITTWNVNWKKVTKLDIKKNTVEKDSDIPPKNCTTPWGKIIEHWASVLAYQQRNDVPDICNIQRRICNDWILWWNFDQKSCQTNLPYMYEKQEVVLYNEKKIDPLIQPGQDVPINKWGTFDIKWKINWYNNPDTLRNNGEDIASQTDNKTVDQTSMIKPNCISPWWNIVLNGQFVRAYRYKNGFINHPCEVELRPCMQGNLEWTYNNSSCKHWDISFEDFMDWYFDKEEPSMLRIIETLNKDIPENEVIIKKWSLWGTLSSLRK
jgi:hypothetical protein